MKREDVKKILTDLGIKDQKSIKKATDSFFNLYGASVNENRKPSQNKVAESNKDNAELEELRKYKADIENKQIQSIRDESIIKLLTGDEFKFDEKAAKLILLATKDKLKFDDKNQIIKDDNIYNEIKNDYKDYVVNEEVKGANPTNSQTKPIQTDPFIEGFNKIRK